MKIAGAGDFNNYSSSKRNPEAADLSQGAAIRIRQEKPERYDNNGNRQNIKMFFYLHGLNCIKFRNFQPVINA